MNRLMGMVFVGTNKDGEEEVLEIFMLAPWERKLERKDALELLIARVNKSWDGDEQFHARRGYKDFGMRTVVIE